MTDDTDRDILQALGRIEGKLDTTKNDINQTLTKVIYALIGIIAANIGVEFTPHSPIDWLGGFSDATRFISIFAIIFTAGRMWNSRTQTQRCRYFKYLIFGFFFLAFTMLGSIYLRGNPIQWILYPARFTYNVFFIWYAWNIEKINGVH